MSTGNHDRRGGSGRAAVRVAVVGLGYWGPSLVRNLHEIPEAEVVLVCDRRQEALTAISRRYPAIRRSSDFGEVLDDSSVEAVVVATPVSTHHELARSSLQASDLVETAKQRGLVLMPGHTFLYSPAVQMIGDLIASGELGEIFFVSTSRVNLGIHQPDVSVIWDLGPHDFSILRHWLGELPSTVTAVTSHLSVATRLACRAADQQATGHVTRRPARPSGALRGDGLLRRAAPMGSAARPRSRVARPTIVLDREDRRRPSPAQGRQRPAVGLEIPIAESSQLGRHRRASSPPCRWPAAARGLMDLRPRRSCHGRLVRRGVRRLRLCRRLCGTDHLGATAGARRRM